MRELARRSEIERALNWFSRERAWINERHLELCRVPAPTFFEQTRAQWFMDQLTDLGWQVWLDRAGNVLATFVETPREPVTIVSAHLDTVYAPAKADDIYYAADGRLVGPGTADNGSGLSALLAIARVLSQDPELQGIAECLLLVANVGEEGEGNLSGMRYLCQQLPEAERLKAFVVLDGPSTEHITAQALASQRYEVTFSGPGGHSWNDHGTPNPVHVLADAIASYVQQAESDIALHNAGLCSYNVGVIEGGNSINAIPSSARAKFDLRSEHPSALSELSAMLTATVERALERGNRNGKARLVAKIKDLGARPGGRLDPGSELFEAVRAVDAHLKIRSRIDCASTDANVPLSMGLPAISIGAGGHGGGAHTSNEWYLPEGREVGLQRILLLLAALTQTQATGALDGA